ncbi:MAG: hypothetical protein JO196_12665 [Hyphomicrobiales bacterium]|nr:hypothetical protein [Alphaproteobacteria bacterium]MBV9053247.1 hypothetical protein [Hyphomicrobiales bacterium]
MALSPSERIADLERLLDTLEQRVTRLNRAAARASASAPDAAARIGDAVAGALGELAERFRGRTQSLRGDVSDLSENALAYGNDAVRRLTREVERKPLVALAVAVGVGVLVASLLVRRD